jgi:CheY-like chemotaxis protein
MGGMQAVRELRALQLARGARCRIVALSSHDDEDTRRAALDAGFDHYLCKPVTREMIQGALVALAGGDTVAADEPARIPTATHAGPCDAVVIDDDMQSIALQFVASRCELVEALAAAARSGEREQVRRLAHQLAGSFALYGFAWAAERSRLIEQQSATIGTAEVEAITRDVLAHLQTARLRTRGGAIIGASPGARGDPP